MSVDAPSERPSRTELSRAPSWILLGFVIGAVFVLLLRRQYLVEEAMLNPPVAGAAAIDAADAEAASPTAARAGEPTALAFDAVWRAWGHHAVWVDDSTQVALWNAQSGDYRDAFEVIRKGDEFYFRPLSRLTRPVVDRGLGVAAPLQFTGPPVVSRRP
ncbi:MAG: hypothetical protein FJ382_09515 [Verrucomicrobia bacterium]|nr:hypothetical protein [Verrucomicrobiota bacterium]